MKKIYLILIGILSFGTISAQWNTERIMTIGRNALYFEDYVLSIQYFNQVIKIKPYLSEPYMYRAIAKIQLGDFQGADEDCSLSIERNPFLTQAYYARGFARKNLKFYKEAIGDFTKALEFSPESDYLFLNRMDAKQRIEDYSGAMSDLDQYMRLNPRNNSVLFEKGCLQLSMKDSVGAEKTFMNFVAKDSTNATGWSALGLLKMQRKDDKGAIENYTKAIKYKSTYVGDYINRGILNVQSKNYKQALTDYDAAIKLDKSNDMAYYNRALLRTHLGDKNNALSDLDVVIRMDSTNNEAIYTKAELERELGNLHASIRDYRIIVKRYPYFIPAILGMAQCEQLLGNIKTAYQYRLMADNIEKNKDNISKKNKQLKTGNKMVATNQKSTTRNKTEFFNRYADQGVDEEENSRSKYSDDDLRGNIQEKYVDVVNEKNFVLSYYRKNEDLRRTNTYNPTLEAYNKAKKLHGNLYITNNEIALTPELINTHFESINQVSAKIVRDDNNADYFFNRAIEFTMVQDFNSSIEDLNRAIALRPDFALAYFFRANTQYKLIEFQRNNHTESVNKSKNTQVNKETKFDMELIMRDYDRVSELLPEFSFAYYNKGNILCAQKDFKTAISYYNKAIDNDRDFAEAYYNRGLTYLYTGEETKGLSDLSKAGELGIYTAYNLIHQYKK